MKRTTQKIYGFTLLALLLILAACTNTDAPLNTISVAELTDRENAILSTTAEQSFIFDFSVDDEYEEISVWVEKYEFGQLVKDYTSEMTTTVEDDGFIIFTTSKTVDESSEKTFNIGVGDQNGSSSIINIDKNAADLHEMPSVWGNFSESKALNEKESALASIGYSSNASGISSFSNDFYDDMEAYMDKLATYDVAYVLKAKLKK